MFSSPSLPQQSLAPKARLFLALWPGPAARNGLLGWRDGWIWPAQAALEPPERLHLTLHFLGDVPRDRLPELSSGLALPFRPFDLRFGRAERWPHGVAVLEPDAAPAGLLQLHASLGEALARLGLPTEARAFRPHVTLARRAGGAGAPAHGPLVRWRVRSYALVESQRTGGGYRIEQRYG